MIGEPLGARGVALGRSPRSSARSAALAPASGRARGSGRLESRHHRRASSRTISHRPDGARTSARAIESSRRSAAPALRAPAGNSADDAREFTDLVAGSIVGRHKPAAPRNLGWTLLPGRGTVLSRMPANTPEEILPLLAAAINAGDMMPSSTSTSPTRARPCRPTGASSAARRRSVAQSSRSSTSRSRTP